MRIGVFAKTFAGSDPRAVLAQVAGAGFTTTQYNMSCSGLASLPDAVDAHAIAAVRAAATNAGIEIAALSATFNMIHPDPASRALGLRRLGVLARSASAMGARLVTLCTGTRDPDDQWRGHPENTSVEAWRDLLAGMEVAIAHAEEADIDLGIEPERANVVSSAETARHLIDELGSRRLKIVFDAANLFEVVSRSEQREIVSRGLDLLADRLVLAHAKDRLPDASFAAAGRGVLDYAHYVAELRRVGFDGAIVAHGLQAAEAPAVAAFLKRTVATITA
jgi:sugar phosphate isomerase/epimerase